VHELHTEPFVCTPVRISLPQSVGPLLVAGGEACMETPTLRTHPHTHTAPPPRTWMRRRSACRR
jgi:hypothetical protein